MSRADCSEALHVIIETQCLANAVFAQSMHSASRPNVSRMQLLLRVCSLLRDPMSRECGCCSEYVLFLLRPNVSQMRLLLRVCTLLRDPCNVSRLRLLLRVCTLLRDPMPREYGCCSELVCKYSASRPNVLRMRLLLLQSKDATIAHACRDPRASRVAFFFPSMNPAL